MTATKSGNRMPHIWLRAEAKAMEQRTALTPVHARSLLDVGFRVTVEACPQRAIPVGEYERQGCEVTDPHSWQAAAPADAFVFGLKELPSDSSPLSHRHIHFAHVYKEQRGWREQLRRFARGSGELYDLEYLVDEKGRRVAAFGRWAGFAGAAVALLAWVGQQSGDLTVLGRLGSRPNRDRLVSDVREALAKIDRRPEVFVVGALGRSGQGAVELCRSVGVDVVQWDLAETKHGGPFEEILDSDIFVNCVFVQGRVAPFLTPELLQSTVSRLSVICDVSCDPYSEYNPLPIYHECTDFECPTNRLVGGSHPIDLIAIDHLPSLLPVESSEDFCHQLVPHLLQLDDLSSGVWGRAKRVFDEKVKQAMQD